MEIYAKASLEVDEINQKVACGCDGIEYNLMDDFIRLGKDFLNNYDEEIFHTKDIKVVHAPRCKNKEMMCIDRAFLKEDISDVENVFRLAQYLGEYWKHPMIVVIHCMISYQDFLEYELLHNRMVRELERLFEKYPLVDLAIENGVFMEFKLGESRYPRLYNGIYMDIPEIVRWLRERLGSRIGSVLDVCHAKMTEKYLPAILRETEYYDMIEKSHADVDIDYRLEHYFELNQGLCKLIHFNELQQNGYGKSHGVGFQNQQGVDEVLNLYRKYDFTCPITIEIREDDYLDCKNYRQTKSLVDDWIKRNILFEGELAKD